MNQGKLFHRLKYILTAAACINLVLLFVFHYELPSFLKHKLTQSQEQKQASSTVASKDTLTVQFETDELTYKGSGSLNLTKGVTVLDENGVEVKATLYSEIKDGNSKSQKIIQYVAEDSYGNTGTASRTLVLKSYDGPSIQISDDHPSIDDTELKSLSSIFKDSNALAADDGYGNDITSSIEASYTIEDMEAQEIKITFKVTNLFNDSASKSITIPLHRTKPLIVLSKEAIHLDLGTTFLATSYIASATDEDGNDISTAVYTEGDIDTGNAGTYRITYKLTDANGNEADPVSLKITVN